LWENFSGLEQVQRSPVGVVLLSYDKVRFQSSTAAVETLTTLKFELLPHQLDITHLVNHMFGQLKAALRG